MYIWKISKRWTRPDFEQHFQLKTTYSQPQFYKNKNREWQYPLWIAPSTSKRHLIMSATMQSGQHYDDKTSPNNTSHYSNNSTTIKQHTYKQTSVVEHSILIAEWSKGIRWAPYFLTPFWRTCGTYALNLWIQEGDNQCFRRQGWWVEMTLTKVT